MKTHTTRTIRSARGYPHERHGFHRYWVQANKLYIVHIDFQFERKKNNTRIDFNEKYDCPNCSVLICLVSIHLNRWFFLCFELVFLNLISFAPLTITQQTFFSSSSFFLFQYRKCFRFVSLLLLVKISSPTLLTH